MPLDEIGVEPAQHLGRVRGRGSRRPGRRAAGRRQLVAHRDQTLVLAGGPTEPRPDHRAHRRGDAAVVRDLAARPTVRATADVWVARGLVNVPSGPIDLEDCAAVPVGPDGWYLRRPGFAWGGIGVAACWYGGAVGIARTLRNAMSSKPPDQIATMHLGAVDAALTAARAVLAEAAAQIDGGSVDRCRSVVARRPGARGRRAGCRRGHRAGRDTHSGRRRWRWTSGMPGGSPICPAVPAAASRGAGRGCVGTRRSRPRPSGSRWSRNDHRQLLRSSAMSAPAHKNGRRPG